MRTGSGHLIVACAEGEGVLETDGKVPGYGWMALRSSGCTIVPEFKLAKGPRNSMEMKFLRSVSVCLMLLFSLSPALVAADSEECKDSPLVARVPGSTLAKCGHQESGQIAVSVRKGKDVVEKTLAGDYQSWGYVTKNGETDAHVFQNIEEALKQAGFQIDFESDPERLTAHRDNTWYSLENRGDYYKQVIITVKN